MSTHDSLPSLVGIRLVRDRVSDWDMFPFSIPCLRALEYLEVSYPVCFFVGENGSGKSTILEAIATTFGFGPQGGSKHTRIGSLDQGCGKLADALRLTWRRKPLGGYFLRTESFFNIASYIDELQKEDADAYTPYGGISLHAQSHGESFLSLFQYRFSGEGFYVLDEPEAALSPQRQLTFLILLERLVASGGNAQFIIATHSPILLAYPRAQIFSFDSGAITQISYRETEAYKIASGFLQDPDLYLKHLFA